MTLTTDTAFSSIYHITQLFNLSRYFFQIRKSIRTSLFLKDANSTYLVEQHCYEHNTLLFPYGDNKVYQIKSNQIRSDQIVDVIAAVHLMLHFLLTADTSHITSQWIFHQIPEREINDAKQSSQWSCNRDTSGTTNDFSACISG